MATIKLKNKFVWEEEIPEIRKKGDIFRDRILVITTNGGKTIKFSTSFTYDLPEVKIKVMVVEGAAMMAGFAKGQAGFEKLELRYFSICGRFFQVSRSLSSSFHIGWYREFSVR